ncbi:MAG TPA: YihY/virulence factor BrkB family protein [Terriglobales bacterium]|nr:YihY/virulence factor BrkB family protein [Terriglobales bacterium]
MDLSSFAKKLVRTVARVIPQCGMVSQAVAFNMFLVFFPSLLFALGLMSRFLSGKNGQDLAARASTILPPGGWQLISDFVLRRGVNPWIWVLVGWVGTLLTGSQVMKLIMEGIHLIYGEREKDSFFGRQSRGLLLFAVSVIAWLFAVALSVFGRPLRHLMIREFGNSPSVRDFWIVMLPLSAMALSILVLTFIYWVAARRTTRWLSVLPGAAAATILWWAVNLLFGAYVRKMHYGPIYGGIAAVFGLMIWMEFSTMIVFLGAAWNAESSQSIREQL